MKPWNLTACIKNIVSWIFTVSAVFLFALLPWMYNKLHPTVLIIFYSSFVLDFIVNKRYKTFAITKPSLVYICFIIFFFLIIIHALFETNTQFTNKIIEVRLSYLGIGLVGLLGGLGDKIKIKYFAYTGIIMSLACLIHILNIMGWSDFIYNNDRFIIFNDLRHRNINAHMGFNFYILFSISLSYCRVKDYFNKENSLIDKIMTWFCSISSVILLWFVINSQGRIGMALAILLIIFIAVDILKHKPMLLGGAALIIIIISVFSIINEPRFSHNSLIEQNPRLHIWELSLKKISEKPIIGYGSSTAYSIMQEEFLTDQWRSKINDGMIYDCLSQGGWWAAHSHNYFLQCWLELGILGLIVSLSIIIIPFFCLKHDKFFMPFCLILLFLAIQMQTDIVDGAYSAKHFCFFYLLILSLQGDKKTLIPTAK